MGWTCLGAINSFAALSGNKPNASGKKAVPFPSIAVLSENTPKGSGKKQADSLSNARSKARLVLARGESLTAVARPEGGGLDETLNSPRRLQGTTGGSSSDLNFRGQAIISPPLTKGKRKREGQTRACLPWSAGVEQKDAKAAGVPQPKGAEACEAAPRQEDEGEEAPAEPLPATLFLTVGAPMTVEAFDSIFFFRVRAFDSINLDSRSLFDNTSLLRVLVLTAVKVLTAEAFDSTSLSIAASLTVEPSTAVGISPVLLLFSPCGPRVTELLTQQGRVAAGGLKTLGARAKSGCRLCAYKNRRKADGQRTKSDDTRSVTPAAAIVLTLPCHIICCVLRRKRLKT